MGGGNKQVADALVAIDIRMGVVVRTWVVVRAGVVVRTWVVGRAGVCLVVQTT